METQVVLQRKYDIDIYECSMESYIKTEDDMMKSELVSRIKELLENEARSCPMDFGCVTPVYVYRMRGGSVAIEEIANAMSVLRQVQYQCG